jgi:hypothetical protein
MNLLRRSIQECVSVFGAVAAAGHSNPRTSHVRDGIGRRLRAAAILRVAGSRSEVAYTEAE